MLQLTVPAQESWDAKNRVFVVQKETTLQLEHSLVSLSKWESKWCKPFLSKLEKTDEELLDYIKCMTITQNVSPEVYVRISTSVDILDQIRTYINSPMTATTFSKEDETKGKSEIVTAEIIYYWMVTFNIPVKFETWHLNRLLTLIRVCSVKNSQPKKRNRKDVMSRQAALNAARKKRLNTKG